MVFGCRRVILYLELGIGVWVEPIEFLLFEWVFCVEPDDLCEVEVGAYNNAHRNSGKDHIYVLFALINKYLPVYQVRQCRQKHKWLQKPGNESHLGVKEHVFVIAMSPDSERPSYNIYEERSNNGPKRGQSLIRKCFSARFLYICVQGTTGSYFALL
jgi:hypothetical protein